jgi:hypothetical protein
MEEKDEAAGKGWHGALFVCVWGARFGGMWCGEPAVVGGCGGVV